MNNGTKVTTYAVKSATSDRYCSIQTKYNEPGTLTPNCDVETAYRFPGRILAMNCIKRTYEARDMVQDSMYANWAAMADIVNVGELDVVEIVE